MAWAPGYASTAELAAQVRISDTADDVQLSMAITAASRAIDHACHRQFGQLAAVEARYYTARWDREGIRWVVDVDDYMTTTGLVVTIDLNGLNSYDYTVSSSYLLPRPANAVAKQRPYTQLAIHRLSAIQPYGWPEQVEVTARWGWTAVPSAVKQACLLQASRFLSRRDSPYGIAGSPSEGSEMRLLARLDPDVAVVMAPYRRWWGAV
jgi:hypothetical protein